MSYVQTGSTLSANIVWQSSTSWTSIVGNLANVNYRVKLQAKNGGGVISSTGTESSLYTMAQEAAAPTLSNATTSSVNISILPDGNPSGTQYAIWVSTDDWASTRYVQADKSMGTSLVWQSSSSWTQIISTNANVNYRVKVQSRNGNSVVSSTGPETSLYGLAIVPVMIAAATFGLISYLAGNAVFAEYLQIRYVAGTGELAVLCGAVIGASLGFLWFNAPPASIFMGDTGSLALGGLLGAVAVAIKHEIVLAIVGGLFVLEAVSVIVQVVSFKLTGKRVFKMAPIHHHYEQLGWTEPQIVIRFWIVAVVLALAGLATLQLR
jgi:hypothetical protein